MVGNGIYIFYCVLIAQKHNKEICIVFFEIKKPLICQAGSAEAFAGFLPLAENGMFIACIQMPSSKF
jgi:hypothetical protein